MTDPSIHRTTTSNSPDHLEDRALSDLAHKSAQDLAELVRRERELGTLEYTQALGRLRSDLGKVAVGGAVLFLGGAFCMATIAALLWNVMPGWLAIGLVGVTAVVIGTSLLLKGRSDALEVTRSPSKVGQSVRDDVRNMREALR